MTQLRPAQAEILRYTGGKMAVSAVPGSGKTFTLSTLAAQLIADGQIDPLKGQQILIVTYLNSSAENFKTKLREKLESIGLPPVGYDARTLHSLSLEIVKLMHGDVRSMPAVIDEAQANHFLARAIDVWKEDHAALWETYLPDATPRMKVRWREMVERTAKSFIRDAKNERYRPSAILEKLNEVDTPEQWQFTRMLAEIYDRYQQILTRQGALDYDDQIWLAADYVENTPDLAENLRNRWPYILEDEAQDSVPLQEKLLSLLVGEAGNLVRVGDPNQAITSTFTAAHPRFFNAFSQQADVAALPLPNSGRNAPIVFSTANRLVDWVTDHHPVLEVRANTFKQQHIVPTPEGDAQPNPPDDEANVHFTVYAHREDEEIPRVVGLAQRYMQKFPERTVAILVGTNRIGQAVAEKLDEYELRYDNLLKGGTRERQIASVLHSLLALMADPLRRKHLRDAFEALRELDHPAANEPIEDLTRFYAVLGSIPRAEQLLYPTDDDGFYSALPTGVATSADIAQLRIFTRFLRKVFTLRTLPIDALTLALSDELFARSDAELREGDLAIAYQIAFMLRSWQDLDPNRRLPDLVAELQDVAEGRRQMNVQIQSTDGFEPRAGYITLATQHGSKGLEWDAVFLIGLDRFWLPDTLEAQFMGVSELVGGDPQAQASAELAYLMQNMREQYEGRSPTEAAHIDTISERLRLLYVGITRGRRFVQLSRSKFTRGYRNQDREAQGTEVIGILSSFVDGYKQRQKESER